MVHQHKHQPGKACPSCSPPQKKWYKERLFLVSVFIVIFLFASLFVAFLNPVLVAFIDYVSLIWWALVIGFLLGGIIDYLVPDKYIQKYLAQHKKRTILYSVVFGFLMSACSHGILAIAIELYKKGASTPSVITFLLASPWANLPITILLFGFFGLPALYIVFSAVIIAIITGLIYQFLDKRCIIECNKKHGGKTKADSFSIRKDVKQRLKNYRFTLANLKESFLGIARGSWELSKMVLWWILIGMFLASLARAYISHEMFMLYLGPTLIGLAATLVLATVLEVCSEGTAPLAFEIFNQTSAFGNSFVLLMAGVVTDYTEIGLIWHNIGKRAAILLPVITVPMVLLLGYLFNLLL